MNTKPLHHYRVGDEIVVSEKPPGNASHLARCRDEETAELFVRCVNTHEALVAALQSLVFTADNYYTYGNPWMYDLLEDIHEARDALAAAEPVPPEEGT